MIFPVQGRLSQEYHDVTTSEDYTVKNLSQKNTPLHVDFIFNSICIKTNLKICFLYLHLCVLYIFTPLRIKSLLFRG